jgi:uncharacterized metal-binding protein YceD (DUF177 family)
MAESADHTKRIVSEWTHLVEAGEVTAAEMRMQIAPQEENKKDIAKRLGILQLQSLKAKISLRRENKRMVKVSGSFKASVVQECVVTLQPVSEQISENFEAWFADPQQVVSFARARHERDKEKSEIERPMLEEYEDPEPIIDGQIDVGEVVLQFLSLSINPFPRSKEAQAAFEREEGDSPKKRENPFAALKALKDDQ